MGNEFEFKVMPEEIDDQDYSVGISFSSPMLQIDIETIEPVETIEEMREVLLKPLLSAIGYHSNLITELFGKKEDVPPMIFTYDSKWEPAAIDVMPESVKELFDQVNNAEPRSPFKAGDCFVSLEDDVDVETVEGEVFVLSTLMYSYSETKAFAISLKDGRHYDNPYTVKDSDNITRMELSNILPLSKFERLTAD